MLYKAYDCPPSANEALGTTQTTKVSTDTQMVASQMPTIMQLMK